MFIILEEIIRELAKAEEEGLSYYGVYKKLTNDYGMDISEVTPRHHLEKLRKRNLVKKDDGKYILDSDAIAFDGSILFSNPPLLLNCPYSEECESECMSKDCKFYKESPDEFKKFLDTKIIE